MNLRLAESELPVRLRFERPLSDDELMRFCVENEMLRVERDWSLKDLAAATKLSISQISSIERGANLPSIESLLAICRAFDKRPSEVLSAIDF